ncbi:MAG: S8 family serine peptidase [Candidatus Sericytochromatia bacterium]|nr:S8 family serine peptidase [Candidatus Sericytochromatia bacterium]
MRSLFPLAAWGWAGMVVACAGTGVRPPVGRVEAASLTLVVPGAVLVRLNARIDPGVVAARHGYAVERLLGLDMVRMLPASTGQTSPDGLKRDPAVSWVENERVWQAPAVSGTEVTAPEGVAGEDPLVPAQWGYLKLEGPALAAAGQTGRREVTVAIIDSGIDGTHPEFVGQLVPGWDFTAKLPGPGGDRDKYGHGTHVAGVVGARLGNGEGIAGLAPGCGLMSVRIFNDFGHTRDGLTAEAVIWAVDHGARVINCSWGSPMDGQAVRDAISYAASKDVVVVAAVGNSGKNEPNWPGAQPEVLGVSASTDLDGWASFSTWGDWVDLAAPGKAILSTFPVALGNGYRTMEGTSMAAPFVTAAAALVRSAHPDWSAAQVREALERTAKDTVMTGRDGYSGFGRVVPGAALGFRR